CAGCSGSRIPALSWFQLSGFRYPSRLCKFSRWQGKLALRTEMTPSAEPWSSQQAAQLVIHGRLGVCVIARCQLKQMPQKGGRWDSYRDSDHGFPESCNGPVLITHAARESHSAQI